MRACLPGEQRVAHRLLPQPHLLTFQTPTHPAQEVVGALIALLACLPEEDREARVLPTYCELARDPVWSVRQVRKYACKCILVCVHVA